MALIVKVYINSHCLIDTHVTRVSGKPPGHCMYVCPDGTAISHRYSDGAARLAIKILKRIKS